MSDWPDDLLAVMAHGLLNSMGVVSGAAETMKVNWGRLDDSIQLELLDKMIAQSAHVSDVLGDLIRSGRPELIEALDRLTDEA